MQNEDKEPILNPSLKSSKVNVDFLEWVWLKPRNRSKMTPPISGGLGSWNVLPWVRNNDKVTQIPTCFEPWGSWSWLNGSWHLEYHCWFKQQLWPNKLFWVQPRSRFKIEWSKEDPANFPISEVIAPAEDLECDCCLSWQWIGDQAHHILYAVLQNEIAMAFRNLFYTLVVLSKHQCGQCLSEVHYPKWYTIRKMGSFAPRHACKWLKFP